MRKLGAVLTLVGGLGVLGATPAFANGFQSYRICGGNTFSTCAAVEVTVTGQNVSIRVWNLAQNNAATYAQAGSHNSIIGGIAFYNIPAGVHVTPGSLQMTGNNARASQDGWNLKNFGDVAFGLDARSAPHHFDTGIASGCSPAAQANLAVNACSASLGNSANWVTFNFQVTGHWDPRTSDISIVSYDGTTGQASDNWTGPTPFGGNPGIATTITPEPVTMTLIATGLAGMSGAGFLRRKRKTTDVS